MVNAKLLKKDDKTAYVEIPMDWKTFSYGFEDHCTKLLVKALKIEYEKYGEIWVHFGDLTDDEEKKYSKLPGNYSVLKYRIASKFCNPEWHFIEFNTSSPFALWLCGFDDYEKKYDDDDDE